MTVTISPAAATGAVTLLDGDTVLGSADLVDGAATMAVPSKTLVPGSYPLQVSYGGDDVHAASSSTLTLQVDKTTPRLKVKAPKKVKQGKRPTVKVTVSAAHQVPATGQVRIKVRPGKTITRTVRDGKKLTVKLPRAKRTKKLKVKVLYLGSDLVERTSSKVVIRVKKR